MQGLGPPRATSGGGPDTIDKGGLFQPAERRRRESVVNTGPGGEAMSELTIFASSDFAVSAATTLLLGLGLGYTFLEFHRAEKRRAREHGGALRTLPDADVRARGAQPRARLRRRRGR